MPDLDAETDDTESLAGFTVSVGLRPRVGIPMREELRKRGVSTSIEIALAERGCV